MNTGLIITIVVCALLLLIGGGVTIYYTTNKKQQSNNNYNDDFKLINEQEQTPTKETDGKSQSDKDKKELYDKNKDKAFKSILNTTTNNKQNIINNINNNTNEKQLKNNFVNNEGDSEETTSNNSEENEEGIEENNEGDGEEKLEGENKKNINNKDKNSEENSNNDEENNEKIKKLALKILQKRILEKLDSLSEKEEYTEKEEYRSVVNELKKKVKLFTLLFSFKEKCYVATYILTSIPSSGENKNINEGKDVFNSLMKQFFENEICIINEKTNKEICPFKDDGTRDHDFDNIWFTHSSTLANHKEFVKNKNNKELEIKNLNEEIEKIEEDYKKEEKKSGYNFITIKDSVLDEFNFEKICEEVKSGKAKKIKTVSENNLTIKNNSKKIIY